MNPNGLLFRLGGLAFLDSKSSTPDVHRWLNPKAGIPHQRCPAMGPTPTLTMAVRPCTG